MKIDSLLDYDEIAILIDGDIPPTTLLADLVAHGIKHITAIRVDDDELPADPVKTRMAEIQSAYYGANYIHTTSHDITIEPIDCDAIVADVLRAASIALDRGIGVLVDAQYNQFSVPPDGALFKNTDIVLARPYSKLTLDEIIKIGVALGVDYRYTISCIKGNDCGECSKCKDRIHAFILNGCIDPLESEYGGEIESTV